MSNATPTNRTVLISLGRKVHAGQLAYAASVGLAHHLAPAMLAKIQKIEGDPAADAGTAARKGSQLVYRASVEATGAAEAALMNFSDTTVKEYLDGYRSVLQGILGKKANDRWVTAGFPAGEDSRGGGRDKGGRRAGE